MPQTSTPNLPKRKFIHKSEKIYTTIKVKTQNKLYFTKQFLKFLRTIAHPQLPRPTNPLISFLDLKKSRKQVSLHYIPSIQNMISEQNIEERNIYDSKSSIQHGFSDDIVSQDNYEMKVIYMCMLEKIMKKLQYNTSGSQRKKIIRGVWNILMKYCKDNNYFIFSNIGTKIQWGLLQLVNFNFSITNKQKYRAETLLHQKSEQFSQISLQLS